MDNTEDRITLIVALEICDSFYYSPCFDCRFLLDQDGISSPSTCLFEDSLEVGVGVVY
jgi:hypothetical protein